MTKEEVLQKCTVEGMLVKLPAEQLDRKLYVEVASALNKIGGKWKGGKVMGFEFSSDPSTLLEEIAGGVKRNIKKEFQFYGTSDELSDELVVLANITEKDIILEPSAGQGAIIKAIQRVIPKKLVHWCELMSENQTHLRKISNAELVCEDIFEHKIKNFYDKIVANPPFSKNQDIDHVMKMYDLLKKGGRLVSIMSSHWKTSKNKKETEFREFIKKTKATVKDVEAGAFKQSGTNVATVIVVIDKK